MSEKPPKTERSDAEMDTEGGGEVGTSQSQSRYKKGHMTNIYLTDEEAILDFFKDRKKLYNKTNEHFKDKTRKECLLKCARLGLNPKGLTTENTPVKVWPGSQGNDREEELDSG